MQTKSSRKGKSGVVTDEMRQQVEEFYRQSALAEKRMGRTPEERLRWLVKFTQQDLDTLRPEERIALGYDLRMLASLGWAPPKSMKGLGGHSYSFEQAVGPMLEADLRAFQAEIARALEGLLSGRSWDIPGSVRMFISRMSPPGTKKTRFQVGWQGDERAAIFSGVLNLLLQAGDALKACAECQRPLVARKRQIYCSAVCSQRVRDRKRPIRGRA
jgi:hypothetical protein